MLIPLNDLIHVVLRRRADSKTTLWHTFSNVQHFPVNHAVSVCVRTNGELTLETAAATLGYAVWCGPPPALGARPAVQTRGTTVFAAIVLALAGGAAQSNGVCARPCPCVSAVTVLQRSCRPMEPTRTRRVRQRVGLNTHAHGWRWWWLLWKPKVVVCLCPCRSFLSAALLQDFCTALLTLLSIKTRTPVSVLFLGLDNQHFLTSTVLFPTSLTGRKWHWGLPLIEIKLWKCC